MGSFDKKTAHDEGLPDAALECYSYLYAVFAMVLDIQQAQESTE